MVQSRLLCRGRGWAVLLVFRAARGAGSSISWGFVCLLAWVLVGFRGFYGGAGTMARDRLQGNPCSGGAGGPPAVRIVAGSGAGLSGASVSAVGDEFGPAEDAAASRWLSRSPVPPEMIDRFAWIFRIASDGLRFAARVNSVTQRGVVAGGL